MYKSCTNVQIPHWYASDISLAALKVAKQNAKKHRAVIKFIHSNILENVRMSFDIIIANLPYGWSEWKNNCSMETVGLKFEPKEALFTKENGLMIKWFTNVYNAYC